MKRCVRFLLQSVLAIAIVYSLPLSGLAAVSYTVLYRSYYVDVASPGALGISVGDTNFGLGPWSRSDGIVDPIGSAGVTTTSNIDSSNITMSGQLSTSTPPNYSGQTRSDHNIHFTLSTNTPFFYSWTKTDEVELAGTILGGGGGSAYSASSASGVLSAGDYYTQIAFRIPITSAGGTKSGTYSFILSFTPEPSSIMLGLTGGAFVAGARRRR
jgi:hypothetical protein